MLLVLFASACTFDPGGIALDPPTVKRQDGGVAIDVYSDKDMTADAEPKADTTKPMPDVAKPKPDVAKPRPDVAKPKPDLPPPRPDLRLPAAAPPPPSCNAIFGSVWGYKYCGQAPTYCQFFVRSGGYSCSQICKSRGKACVGGWNNKWSGSCPTEGGSNCNYGRHDQICRCRRF